MGDCKSAACTDEHGKKNSPFEPVKTYDSDGEGGNHATAVPLGQELGGPPGPEPTRYGDWEKGGRCIDF